MWEAVWEEEKPAVVFPSSSRVGDLLPVPPPHAWNSSLHPCNAGGLGTGDGGKLGLRVIPKKSFGWSWADLEGPRTSIPEKHIFTQVYLQFCREAGEDLKDPWQDVVPEHSCPHQLPVWGFPGLHLGAEPLIV